jgi:hypothetical protein
MAVERLQDSRIKELVDLKKRGSSYLSHCDLRQYGSCSGQGRQLEQDRRVKRFNYVITVCRESIENKCPIAPGITKRLYWGFDDPAALQGTDIEKLKGTRRIRDEIKSRIESWIVETRTGSGRED